jgi:hypothetical protein
MRPATARRPTARVIPRSLGNPAQAAPGPTAEDADGSRSASKDGGSGGCTDGSGEACRLVDFALLPAQGLRSTTSGDSRVESGTLQLQAHAGGTGRATLRWLAVVTVSPSGVTARYIRAWVPASETTIRKNGQVDGTWSVAAPAASPGGK